MHLRPEIGILANKIIIDLIGLDFITGQDIVYSISRYLGKVRISCVFAVCADMITEFPVCPKFLHIPKFFWFCTGNAAALEFFLVAYCVRLARTGSIIQGIIFSVRNIFCNNGGHNMGWTPIATAIS